MEVKKVSGYTYITLCASVFLWVWVLVNIEMPPSARSWSVFLVATGLMMIIAVGLTKIRKAVGLDVPNKKEFEPEVSKHGLWHYLVERKKEVDNKHEQPT